MSYLRDEEMVARQRAEMLAKYTAHDIDSFSGNCNRCGARKEEFDDNVAPVTCNRIARKP